MPETSTKKGCSRIQSQRPKAPTDTKKEKHYFMFFRLSRAECSLTGGLKAASGA
jgi:hypothetical protein